MNSTLSALIARFPRLAWRAEADHHVGERGGIVVTVWDDGGDLDGWRAFGCADGIRVATRGSSAVAAVEKLAVGVQLSEALHAAPCEPEPWDAPESDPVQALADGLLWAVRSGWALLTLVVLCGLLMCWGAA